MIAYSYLVSTSEHGYAIIVVTAKDEETARAEMEKTYKSWGHERCHHSLRTVIPVDPDGPTVVYCGPQYIVGRE
jgi:hypothetical protein